MLDQSLFFRLLDNAIKRSLCWNTKSAASPPAIPEEYLIRLRKLPCGSFRELSGMPLPPWYEWKEETLLGRPKWMSEVDMTASGCGPVAYATEEEGKGSN